MEMIVRSGKCNWEVPTTSPTLMSSVYVVAYINHLLMWIGIGSD